VFYSIQKQKSVQATWLAFFKVKTMNCCQTTEISTSKANANAAKM